MSEKLVLRQVRESDRWTLWAWRNSERIRRVSIHDEEIPRRSHDEWFTRSFPRMRDKTVIVEWDGLAVGVYQIERWDRESKSGEWGIALGDTSVPRGLGGMLPILVHAHAFDRLNAEQMTGRVLELNTRMLSVMSRLNFPSIVTDDKPVSRQDGSSSRMFVFRVKRTEWAEIFDSARLLTPPSLWRAIDRALSEPLLD